MPTAVISTRPRVASRSIFAALIVVISLSCGVVWAQSARADSTSDLVALTNSARAAHGLAALTVSGDLTAAARAQASRMAASQTLAHTPNLPGAVCCWSALGENVGEGPSATVLQSAFMASPEHRANILSTAYTQIGIGVALDAKGTLWVSEIFREPSGTVPRAAPAPQPVVKRAPTPNPTKAKAAPTTTRSTPAVTETPKARTALTPTPTPTPPAAGVRASRDLPGGRVPLGAAEQFAVQIVTASTASSPDPVSRMLDFVAISAGAS